MIKIGECHLKSDIEFCRKNNEVPNTYNLLQDENKNLYYQFADNNRAYKVHDENRIQIKNTIID